MQPLRQNNCPPLVWSENKNILLDYYLKIQVQSNNKAIAGVSWSELKKKKYEVVAHSTQGCGDFDSILVMLKRCSTLNKQQQYVAPSILIQPYSFSFSKVQ